MHRTALLSNMDSARTILSIMRTLALPMRMGGYRMADVFATSKMNAVAFRMHDMAGTYVWASVMSTGMDGACMASSITSTVSCDLRVDLSYISFNEMHS